MSLTGIPPEVSPDLRRPARARLRDLSRDPLLIFSVFFLIAVLVVAIMADVISPLDPFDMVGDPNLWPFEDASYPFGTDVLGRDLLAGIVHGSRATLLVGVASALTGLVIGVTIGGITGFYSGWLSATLMRLVEIFQTIPPILTIIVILNIGNGGSLWLVTLSIGFAAWPMIARLTRAEFMTLREADFVMAARGLGYGTLRIIAFEILPNAMPTIIVTLSILIANGILLESAISFLNLGDPNVVSWGSLIGTGRAQILTEWYLTALPGVAIMLTVLAINIIGDRVTDMLNPRSRTRQ